MSTEAINHVIQLLEKSKKKESTSFYNEYDISPAQIKTMLIMNGFNQKYKSFLDGYVIDLTSMACYNHALNMMGSGGIYLHKYVVMFTDGTNLHMSNKGKTTDCAWNMTVDEIISRLKTLGM